MQPRRNIPARQCGLALATGLILAAVIAAAPAAGRSSRSDAWLTKQLVGTWQTDSFGKQVLTNHSDGTARLDMSLNRLAALRYGKDLSLDLEWSVESGVLKHTVVGGSPPERVARLVNDLGKTTEYEVLDVSSKQLLLAALDDEDDRHVWQAAPQLAAAR